MVCGIREYVYLEKKQDEEGQRQIMTRANYKKDSSQIQIKAGESCRMVFLSKFEDILECQ